MADPGETIRCPSCGFSATAPGGRSPGVASSEPSSNPQTGSKPVARLPHAGSRAPIQTAASTEGQPLRVLSVWAFLLGFIALGTFYFARFGVPFLIGIAAIVMGAMAFMKNRRDRHGLVALVLGGVALLVSGVYLAIQ
jgi:hypothetical protein